MLSKVFSHFKVIKYFRARETDIIFVLAFDAQTVLPISRCEEKN